MALVGAQFVNAVSPNPVGSLQAYAGASAPAGWLLCDGTSYSTSVYPELFSVLGYTYGGSSGNFNVPDLRGRMPIGSGNDGTAANNATRTRGTKGGDTRLQQHNHTVQENAGNSSTLGGHFTGAGQTASYAGNIASNAYPVFVTNAGSGSGENMPPFLVTNYIIKAIPDAPRSGLAYGSTPPIVTALPVNPQFGEVVTYAADATNGVYWNLQYDASGTYPWKFVGGMPLFSRVNGVFSTTSLTHTAMTGGPSMTQPLPGDYRVDYGFGGYNSVATAVVAVPFWNGATLPGYAYNDPEIGSQSTLFSSPAGALTVTFSTAGGSLAMCGRVDGGTGTFMRRWMALTPIRVKAA